MLFYPLQHLHLLRCIPALGQSRAGQATQDQLGAGLILPHSSFPAGTMGEGGEGPGRLGQSPILSLKILVLFWTLETLLTSPPTSDEKTKE